MANATYKGLSDLRILTLDGKDVEFKPGEAVKLSEAQLEDLVSQGVAAEFDLPTAVDEEPAGEALVEKSKKGKDA